MTLQTTIPLDDYIENGVTLVHAVPFQFQAATDIVCSRIVAGVETVLTLAADYTVTGGAGLTGSVTKTNGGVNGTIFRIKRATTRAQQMDYTPGDAFPAESHEAQLDRLSAVDQEQDVSIADLTNRAVHVPVGETAQTLPTKAQMAGKYLAGDANGNIVPASGTGSDPALRTDLGAPTGAALVGTVQAGAGAVVRSVQAMFRDRRQSVRDYGAAADGSEAAGAFSLLVAAAASLLVPSGAYALSTDVTLGGADFSWRRAPGASFTGIGRIQLTDLPGYNYTADARKIQLIENAGSIASKNGDAHPVALFSKTTNVNASINPAVVVQHNVYGAAANNAGQAAYFEVVMRSSGVEPNAPFGEAIRCHTIVPTGVVARAYGGLFYAENNGTGLYCIGNETEIRRTIAADCFPPRTWTSISQFDGCYLASANTANAAVGGIGGKPAFAFSLNPFNTIPVQCGYLIPKCVQPGGKTVLHTGFACLETGLEYGLDLAKGSYATAAIALPNNSSVRAFNNAGNAEKNILFLGTDDALWVGQETTFVRILAAPIISIGAVATPGNNGELMFQATSNTSLTFKYKGSDGIVRSGSIVLA